MDEVIPMKSKVSLRWRSRCGRYSISIRKHCLVQILSMAREHQPAEIGSSLYGCYSSDGMRAVVLDTAPIPPDSRGTACFFVRGVAGLTEFFRELFTESRGRRHYVGEWHSHPNVSPQPSSLDWDRQREIAEDPAMQCAECILIVLGGDLTHDLQVGVHVHSRASGRTVLNPC